jgi:hypothetical protein
MLATKELKSPPQRAAKEGVVAATRAARRIKMRSMGMG